MNLTVNEIFYSIQGESVHSGLPCTFIRLTGCNLRCSYCDTRYAFAEGRVMDTETIVEQVWGYRGEGNKDLVRGLVQRLRTKVEPDPSNPKYIMTEQGIGYYFNRN